MLAATFAGLAAVFALLGVVYSLVLIPVAVPFAGAAYLLWYHASGRLVKRARRQAQRGSSQQRRSRDRFRRRAAERLGASSWQHRRGDPGTGREARYGPSARPTDSPSRSEAADVLGVPLDADDEQVRAAYRDRAKELHPDAENGSEEAFKRVTAAYERLSDR